MSDRDAFPEVQRTLELLEELREVVAGAAEREGRLSRASSLRVSHLDKDFEESREAEEGRLEHELAEAETAHDEAKDYVLSKHRWREVKIAEAHHISKNRVLKTIDQHEGSKKFSIQKESLDTQRGRDAALKKEDKEYKEFSAGLGECRDRYDKVLKAAKAAVRGYAPFLKLFVAAKSDAAAEPSRSAEHRVLFEGLRAQLDRTDEEAARFRKRGAAGLFRFFPIALLVMLVILVHIAAAVAVFFLKLNPLFYGIAGGSCAFFLVALSVVYFGSRSKAKPAAVEIATGLEKARRLYELCVTTGAANHESERERIKKEAEDRIRELHGGWAPTAKEAAAMRASRPQELDAQKERADARNDQILEEKLARLEPAYAETVARIKSDAEARRAQLGDKVEGERASFETTEKDEWETLIADWNRSVPAAYAAFDAARASAQSLFPAWEPSLWENWSLPADFAHAAKFAELNVDLEALAGAIPKDARLPLPGPKEFSVPLMLTLPNEGSILFETQESGNAQVVGALNNIILRLLSTAPAGRLNFTIFDPVGLGENFAGIMHLADYEEHLINSRIWTQSDQIEQRLAELNEHMEKVIQMYLRNEYETITEYNEKAGTIAEKYHYLVVADFPNGFTDIAAKRLMSIAASGARCGVYTLIHWDARHRPPEDFVAEDMRNRSVWVRLERNRVLLTEKTMEGAVPVLDAPPDPEFAIDFIQRIGQASIDSNRVEVPFAQITPGEEDRWTHDTTNELRVPIGRTGATKFQYLEIGKGTKQHALLAGKTGSGKSTLLHVMITNLALWCDPEHVEFYLVDFKKGVEFKCYGTKHLPHARVVAIESDREFGLSVLQRVDEELKRRGELFRDLGVQDIAGYKRAGGTESIPRTLLIIDEFQELFVEDDRVSQNAAVLLDRIVRQGRAFGIHAILGSQTLGGAFTLARTTLGQMVIRIALQCNEADAYLIMDDSNPAPRLLTRPGEAIYNDSAGMLEGNSPFQVVWLADEERDRCLDEVAQIAERSGKRYARPIVFEGNAPADIRENNLLRDLLEAEAGAGGAVAEPATARVWMGAPNSIKGPTEAAFQRQSGNNLLIVGQREEASQAILTAGLVALAAQFPRGGARFVVFDGNAPDSAERVYLEKLTGALPQECQLVKAGDVDEVMAGLGAELRRRSESEGEGGDAGPRTFIFLNGLQKFKKLRFEEDFSFSTDDDAPANPGTVLNDVITDGASHGMHVIAVVDTYNNVNRFLSRKALSEFEMRVLFQMSANDSASLIDSPKAGNLGLHRALFYNEQEGYLETFRPYALPKESWVEEAGEKLAKLHGAGV